MKFHRMASVVLALLLFVLVSKDKPSISYAVQLQAGLVAYNKPDALSSQLDDVWLITSDGSGDRRIPVNLVTAQWPVWSRDGQLMAATGEVPTAGNNASSNFFVFNAAGGNLRQVTTYSGQNTGGYGPLFKSFSPDGQSLAYVFIELNVGTASVWVTRLDGTGLTFVGGTSNTEFEGWGIDWSPKTALLITPEATIDFSSGYPLAVTAIFSMPPAVNGMNSKRQITSPHAVLGESVLDQFPVFSPDGQQIAFTRRDVNNVTSAFQTSIGIVNLNGTNERLIATFPGEYILGLSWSGSGTNLVFDRGGQSGGVPTPGSKGLWTINVNGTGLQQIKTGPATSPSWNWSARPSRIFLPLLVH